MNNSNSNHNKCEHGDCNNNNMSMGGHGHRCGCGSNCDCGCWCGGSCKCGDNCTCGCKFGRECTCGEKCGCFKKNSCNFCGANCNKKHRVIRILLLIALLVFTFWMGEKVGRFRGEFGWNYYYGQGSGCGLMNGYYYDRMNYGRYNMPMYQNRYNDNYQQGYQQPQQIQQDKQDKQIEQQAQPVRGQMMNRVQN